MILKIRQWIFNNRAKWFPWMLYICGVLDAICTGPHMTATVCQDCGTITADYDIVDGLCLWCAKDAGGTFVCELPPREDA